MFDIGASELLLTVIVAIVVIGPKDLPLALRTAGRWIGKVRRISGHFRAGVETMIREAEMAEMEKEWKERNARIMAGEHSGDLSGDPGAQMVPLDLVPEAGAEARLVPGQPNDGSGKDVGGGPPPPP
jgi:sec-independent protein translocase protein TatB